MMSVIYALVTMERPRRPFTSERMLLFDQFAKSVPRLALLPFFSIPQQRSFAVYLLDLRSLLSS